MGQQQLLLIIAGVIIVGIAVAVGVGLFGGNNAQANKDGISSKLMDLTADATGYKMRPKVLGGGRPSYKNYQIPQQMQSDDNGTYTINGTIADGRISFLATSSMNTQWTATCDVDSDGKAQITFSGW